MTYVIHTLGCKVNQYESEALRTLLEAGGYQPCVSGTPDVAILNSCTVTAESDRKSRQAVRRMRKNWPLAVVVLLGCMSQSSPADAAALTGADIVLGHTGDIDVLSYIGRFLADRERIVDIRPHCADEKYSGTAPVYAGENVSAVKTRAMIKIEDGCDRRCAYCAIPYARGSVRSKPIDDIEREAAGLKAAGYKEISLVGINLSDYGKDTGLRFADAINAAARGANGCRIRLGSLEPDRIDKQTLDTLQSIPNFCPQFHLSLQSGCEATLRRMNRHYTPGEYFSWLEGIRARFETAAITTDIMVGFPGETDEEFAQSAEFVRRCGFAKVHIFPYSRRAGTPAADMPGQLTSAQKTARAAAMAEIAAAGERSFLRAQTGRTARVLIEKVEAGMSYGYTENYAYTRIPCAGYADIIYPEGQIINVLIEGESNGELLAKLI